LERAGFRAARSSHSRKKGSSHRTYVRERSGGRKDVTVVVLGKRQVPRGTLGNILRLANLAEPDFERHLRS